MSLNVFDVVKNHRGLWYKTKLFFRCLKMAKQRVTRGYCDWDVYDLDCFYRELFIKTLTQLKNSCHGAPTEFFDEGAENETERWEIFLGEMIHCFQMSDEDFENGFKNRYRDEVDAYLMEKEEIPKELYNKFLEEEEKNNKLRQLYLKRGFELMADHFEQLWD